MVFSLEKRKKVEEVDEFKVIVELDSFKLFHHWEDLEKDYERNQLECICGVETYRGDPNDFLFMSDEEKSRFAFTGVNKDCEFCKSEDVFNIECLGEVKIGDSIELKLTEQNNTGLNSFGDEKIPYYKKWYFDYVVGEANVKNNEFEQAIINGEIVNLELESYEESVYDYFEFMEPKVNYEKTRFRLHHCWFLKEFGNIMNLFITVKTDIGLVRVPYSELCYAGYGEESVAIFKSSETGESFEVETWDMYQIHDGLTVKVGYKTEEEKGK